MLTAENLHIEPYKPLIGYDESDDEIGAISRPAMELSGILNDLCGLVSAMPIC